MSSESKKAIDTHKLRTPACSAHKGEQVRNPIESKRARETHLLLSTDRGTSHMKREGHSVLLSKEGKKSGSRESKRARGTHSPGQVRTPGERERVMDTHKLLATEGEIV